MVYIVLRKTNLFREQIIVKSVDSLQNIRNDLMEDAGSFFQDGDEVYEARLVSKIVKKPKVIKTTELVLEAV